MNNDTSEIVMLIPCWRRAPIVQDCYDSIKRLPVRRVWVVSEDDPFADQIYEIVKDDIVVQFCNDQLGRKMNAGIRWIYENLSGWRYLMNWGSDDLCAPQLLDIYKPYMDRNELFFGMNNMYAFDTFDGDTTFFQDYNKDKPIGAGRMIHRIIVETLLMHNETIYTNEARSGLDGDSQKRIMAQLKVKATIVDVGRHPYLVDVKTTININPFVFFKDRPMCKRSIIDKVHGSITRKYPIRPLVSVVIPYKEDRGWLKEAVASVKAQTYPNVELIKSKGSGFVGANLNKGIRQAKGELICYLCDDDTLTPNSIASRVKVWLSERSDLIHANCDSHHPDGVVTTYAPPKRWPTVRQMLERNFISGGTMMYHRSVFEKYGYFDETLNNAEEYDMNVRALIGGATIGYINEVVYNYRVHEKQKSTHNDAEARRKQIEAIRARLTELGKSAGVL